MSELILVCLTNSEHGGVYYPGTLDTVIVDEARSGCRVWMISDKQIPCKNFISYHDCSKSVQEVLKLVPSNIGRGWGMLGIKRNLIVYDFIHSRSDISWPIFPLDNDIMVFSDLNEAYKPFEGVDFTTPIYNEGTSYAGTTGAYSIHNKECLDAGIDHIFNMIDNIGSFNDMLLWSKMFQSGNWKVGNILRKDVVGAFDSSIHMSEDRFVMEPVDSIWGKETKKITWIDGHPYFTELDGSLTIAHWIHCWGSYKSRTKELREKAGL